MRSIGFISEKGGVGKTTTTLNVAAAFGKRGLRVLVVDADPQANASHVLLKGEPARRPSLFDVLIGEADATAAVVPTHFKGVDVLPSDAGLADAMVLLASEVGRERRLRSAMEEAQEAYSFVLVDTAPTRSILTTNVLNYVQEIIVPFTPGLFGVLGLGQLQRDVEQVRRFLENKSLRIGGVVLTAADRNNVHKDVEDQLRSVFGPVVFKTRIPRNIKIEEAHGRHEPVAVYAPRSVGATAYESLAKEIMDGDGKENRHDSSGGDSRVHDAA